MPSLCLSTPISYAVCKKSAFSSSSTLKKNSQFNIKNVQGRKLMYVKKEGFLSTVIPSHTALTPRHLHPQFLICVFFFLFRTNSCNKFFLIRHAKWEDSERRVKKIARVKQRMWGSWLRNECGVAISKQEKINERKLCVRMQCSRLRMFVCVRDNPFLWVNEIL